MYNTKSRSHLDSFLVYGITVLMVLSLVAVPSARASHATDGVDVKVTIDNNNVDGGINAVTPSFDAQNRQSNEPTIAISGVVSPVTNQVGDILASASNDYRMVPHFGDSWMPIYLSFDGGATWYNTMIPGFPTDTSAEGLASPLKNLDGSGDPVVRFDSAGNLYIAGIAFNRNFDQPDRPVDTAATLPGMTSHRHTATPAPPDCRSTTPLHLCWYDHCRPRCDGYAIPKSAIWWQAIRR
jgi:hypothetical protein